MSVFRKFQSSDGRIKIATLSGISVLVAVIALLVGVLPAIADDGGEQSGKEVQPHVIDFGGGSGGCAFVDVDSVAGNELHINNPSSGTFFGPDGTEFTITVSPDDTLLGFTVESPGILVYDVTVNGGSKSNHYDYEASKDPEVPGPGPVTSDTNLHAPPKSGGSADFFKLSHVNICYDGDTEFECGIEVILSDENGPITDAVATIFTNSVVTCPEEGKLGSFFTDGDTVTLDFGTGDDVIAGRLDITKDFTKDATPSDPTDFENLEYNGPGEFVELEWCAIRTPKATGDGGEFDDVLASNEYPSLVGVTDTLDDSTTEDATACKVSEEENAAGIQVTVVYFEFEDPQFR